MYLTDLGGATAIFHQNEVLAGKHWGKLGTFETGGTLFNGNIRNITCSIHIYILCIYDI